MAESDSEALTIWIDKELINSIDDETDNRSRWIREAIRMRLGQDPLEERLRTIEKRLESLRHAATTTKGPATISIGGKNLIGSDDPATWEELEEKYDNNPV